MISYCNSIMNVAQMVPCTPKLLNAALDDPKVAETCQTIAPLGRS